MTWLIPVGMVLPDVVHRHEHRPLPLARQLDVALARQDSSARIRPNCVSSDVFSVTFVKVKQEPSTRSSL